jgi:protein-disulfide isomerase
MTTEWMRPRTSRLSLVAMAVAAAASTLLMTDLLAQEGAKKADPEVLARIGDQTIDRAAVLEEATGALAEVESLRAKCQQDASRGEHDALENATQRVVHKKLFAMEAQRRGVTEDALREEIRTKAGEVSDADIDTFYTENQARIQQPKDKIVEQIRAYLKQTRLQTAEKDFFAEAEKNFKVTYLIEPMRVEVAAAGPAKGPDSAPVTIVEFSDFQCPYCKRVLPTLAQVHEKYGDKVRVVYRHFPLSIHPNAQKAAEASLCAADQGKFWEMHDLLFNEQQKLAVEDLKEKATRLGLDGAAFGQCLDSNKHQQTVLTDARDAAAAGVDGTPAFFINGRFLSGAVGLDKMAELIDDEVRRTQAN